MKNLEFENSAAGQAWAKAKKTGKIGDMQNLIHEMAEFDRVQALKKQKDLETE